MGQDDAVRNRFQFVTYFLDSDDYLLRCKRRFFLDADDSPELHIAGSVRSLRVDDGYVRIDCTDSRKFFSCERTHNGRDR